jgi:hypothetical protein
MSSTDIEAVTHGLLPVEIVEYAREQIIKVSEQCEVPVRHARVKVGHSADPGLSRPAYAKAYLDVDGRELRAHVGAATVREAVDLLRERLDERLSGLVHGWPVEPGPAPRPDYFTRPVAQREIVRRKSYELPRTAPAEAVAEMERLDHDVHLFVDARTGREAVVYRDGPFGYDDRPPRLTTRAAVDRFNRGGQPFLFFADAATGRGRLLYRRYDGHYGLVKPD